MAQQWRISIKGKQRQDPAVDLLIQAVIALGHQLRKEEQAQSSNTDPSTEAADKPEGGSA